MLLRLFTTLITITNFNIFYKRELWKILYQILIKSNNTAYYMITKWVVIISTQMNLYFLTKKFKYLILRYSKSIKALL